MAFFFSRFLSTRSGTRGISLTKNAIERPVNHLNSLFRMIDQQRFVRSRGPLASPRARSSRPATIAASRVPLKEEALEKQSKKKKEVAAPLTSSKEITHNYATRSIEQREVQSERRKGYKYIVVTNDEADMRLDRWIHNYYPHINNSMINKLLRKKIIFLGEENKEKVTGNKRLEPNTKILIPEYLTKVSETYLKERTYEPKESEIEELRSSVIYKDPHIIALNKPSGLSVQGGSKVTRYLAALLPHIRFEAEEPPRLIHRLDMDTSGVLVLARTRTSAAALSKMFKNREVNKTYLAVVVGVPDPKEGRIVVPIAIVSSKEGEKTVVRDERDENTKISITEYQTIKECHSTAALLKLRPATGRKHQLRVHCADVLKTPILGDEKYAKGLPDAFKTLVSKQLHLHASAISFVHPITKSKVSITAPLPKAFKSTCEALAFPTNILQ